jgi:hypothetical protein
LPPLSTAEESKLDKTRRRYAAAQVADEFFAELKAQLGLDDAKKLWRETPKRFGRKRGRPRKSYLADWEASLFEWYDQGTKAKPLAKFFKGWGPQEAKLRSLDALERRIHRLLDDRRKGKIVQEPSGKRLPRYRRV